MVIKKQDEKNVANIQQKQQINISDTSLQQKQRILHRNLLEMYEQVPFVVLNKALIQNTLSHAYLFTGPKGTLKTELALLLAQTVLLGKNTLVQENLLTKTEQIFCENIANHNNPDYYFLNGYRKEALRKEEIDTIPSRFSQKAIGPSGKKIYIIDHFENSSISAMNSLLKFLEEPSENVYAVIITDNINRILPTIISRCVQLKFKPLPNKIYYNLAIKQGIDEEDAYFLSRIIKQTNHFAKIVVSDSYQNAKKMLKQWIGLEHDKRLLLVYYELYYQEKKNNHTKNDIKQAKDCNLDTISYFIDLLTCFYKDLFIYEVGAPTWYDTIVKNYKKDTRYIKKCIQILVQQRDRCNRNNDLNLLLAQTIYRLENETE